MSTFKLKFKFPAVPDIQKNDRVSTGSGKLGTVSNTSGKDTAHIKWDDGDEFPMRFGHLKVVSRQHDPLRRPFVPFQAKHAHEHPTSMPKGSWKEFDLETKPSATFKCPNCGAYGVLEDHEIGGDGSVTPSVVCPEDCGFHDYVMLVGWHGKNGFRKPVGGE